MAWVPDCTWHINAQLLFCEKASIGKKLDLEYILLGQTPNNDCPVNAIDYPPLQNTFPREFLWEPEERECLGKVKNHLSTSHIFHEGAFH